MVQGMEQSDLGLYSTVCMQVNIYLALNLKWKIAANIEYFKPSVNFLH